ncbi:multiple antibiotic resistance regulatory protein MarB [Enterobacteriaceae bacterium H20N1]|uniref:Multiple antibiotic resistance regulatory protein MarB n=1 Tax=Dryocola boscaweniae TaxID=2925397 RepID=A0A9X2WBI0_9ENTR|nr:multiple antibiotic resistance regulatory protein MarB [Dryocola boscaweniae]MCT4703812.1 multiple antibiotic resistance regulatory protein MarB [Dryocola boscaweniae]MCT4720980.1 multiple antibiotic resistance regulatory protein MarB [Dryocola boscaweniae]
MKRFVSAAAVLLVLASGNVWAEQPGNFSVTQANHGGMIIPPSDNHNGASNTVSDKSEQLGAPYYHGNE